MVTPILERIDFISHSEEPPRLFATFFWSEALGLRCTVADVLREYESDGILRHDTGAVVYPRDGRAFFDALKWRASSYVEVTAPRVVASEAV